MNRWCGGSILYTGDGRRRKKGYTYLVLVCLALQHSDAGFFFDTVSKNLFATFSPGDESLFRQIALWPCAPSLLLLPPDCRSVEGFVSGHRLNAATHVVISPTRRDCSCPTNAWHLVNPATEAGLVAWMIHLSSGRSYRPCDPRKAGRLLRCNELRALK